MKLLVKLIGLSRSEALEQYKLKDDGDQSKVEWFIIQKVAKQAFRILSEDEMWESGTFRKIFKWIGLMEMKLNSAT